MKTVSTERTPDTALTESQLRKDAMRVLRRLCEAGALLVVADNMDMAVIVREAEDHEPTRTGVVEKQVAEAMALNGWLKCMKSNRITRYSISAAGRDALSRMLAEAENKAVGFADAQTAFDGPDYGIVYKRKSAEAGAARRKRYSGAESPLLVLARRKDKSGQRFLCDTLVRAGERLREDFELAQLDASAELDWESFLSDPVTAVAQDTATGPRGRVIGALRDLGPGLGDVVLQCCCYLEGLERVEKRMDWSARSGKIVLRIALQRLKRHYDELGDAPDMIG